jgi:hypothetical protein
MSDESGKPSSFTTPNAIVRYSGWSKCGACGRYGHARDPDTRDGNVTVICPGCHRELIKVEWRR